jgi:hypothetical protein
MNFGGRSHSRTAKLVSGTIIRAKRRHRIANRRHQHIRHQPSGRRKSCKRAVRSAAGVNCSGSAIGCHNDSGLSTTRGRLKRSQESAGRPVGECSPDLNSIAKVWSSCSEMAATGCATGALRPKGAARDGANRRASPWLPRSSGRNLPAGGTHDREPHWINWITRSLAASTAPGRGGWFRCKRPPAPEDCPSYRGLRWVIGKASDSADLSRGTTKVGIGAILR